MHFPRPPSSVYIVGVGGGGDAERENQREREVSRESGRERGVRKRERRFVVKREKERERRRERERARERERERDDNTAISFRLVNVSHRKQHACLYKKGVSFEIAQSFCQFPDIQTSIVARPP